MGRFLVLVLLALVAVWLIRRALRRMETRGGKPRDPAVSELVSCAHCGVHLPRSEARQSEDRLYCSDEHARLGPGQS